MSSRFPHCLVSSSVFQSFAWTGGLNLDTGLLPRQWWMWGNATFFSDDENHPDVSQDAVCTLCTESTQLADVQPDANSNCPWIVAATQLVISQIALADWVSPPGHRDFCFPLLKSVLWFLLASSQVLLDWDFIMHRLHNSFLFFTSYVVSFKGI